MDLKLVGRNCLITGASTGIGSGVANALAKEGAQVIITARRKNLLENIADQVSVNSVKKPIVISGDITDKSDSDRIVKEARSASGHIDILVNCAGGSSPTRLEDDDYVWQQAFDLNFHSTRRITHALVPYMRAAGWGRIINFSGSMEPRSLNAASSAKAAIHLWSKGLSCEVAANGVTVNSIAPGRINSEQILQKLYPTEESRSSFIKDNIPIGYFGDPEDVANLVVFLASPLARYITGAVIPVDGGMHYFAH